MILVRKYIFTDHERQIVEKFIGQGEKDQGFKMIVHRLRRRLTTLEYDYGLAKALLEKLDE